MGKCRWTSSNCKRVIEMGKEENLYFVTVKEVYDKIKQLRKKEQKESNEKEQEIEKIENSEEIDEALLFASERSIDMVKGYCCVKEVPKELKNVCVEIGILLYDNEGYEQKEQNRVLKSIQEGNVSVTYQSEGSNWKEYRKTLLDMFQEELNQFRRMRW